MGNAAIGVLMRQAIDYAGMFPPATLPVADSAAAYMRARKGAYGWLLGTLVVAADRITELDAVVVGDVPLGVVMKEASAAAVDRVMRAAGALRVTALEFPPASGNDIRAASGARPPGTSAFFEAPPDIELEHRLDAIADVGAFAKVRTGGVTATAFPPDAAIYRFFKACADRTLACKATAGLHHAVAGPYPLTYEPQSASAPMSGFLNVGLSAVLIRLGAPQADVLALLREPSADALERKDPDIIWRDYRITPKDAAAAREHLFRSFGSCSVQEPIDDLVRLQLV